MDCIGLIYDDSPQFVDHLAPFCSLLNIPLIVCEPNIAHLCGSYYPNLEVIEISLWDLLLPPFVISCDNIPLLKAAFPNQNFTLLWLPHGNSDKGREGPFFEGIGDLAFVYGQRMIDFMHEKKAFPKMMKIGNFRYYYFLKHLNFYKEKLKYPEGKNILYAPTWEDNILEKPLPSIKKGQNLLIKFHPNTYKKYLVEIEILQGKVKKEEVIFLPNIPPIYPLLNICDEYIGDFSSIGYDFLTFNRPIHNTALDLLDKKKMYSSTFDPTPDWDQIKEQIYEICSV